MQGDLADLGADDDDDGGEDDAENGAMNGGTARGGALSDSGEPSTSGTMAASNPYINTPAHAHNTSGQRCDGCPPHRSCAPLTTSRARCV